MKRVLEPKIMDNPEDTLAYAQANFTTSNQRLAIIQKLSDKHGGVIPLVHYTPEEDKVWQSILVGLEPLHKRYASSVYRNGLRKLCFSPHRLPELRDVSNKLKKITGFKLVPVRGLVKSQVFLQKLARHQMLATQFVRNPSNTWYSPVPDICHELIGHTPYFTDKRMIEVYKIIGKLAARARGNKIKQIERLAWFIMEVGLIREKGKVKILGTAILSSKKEIVHVMSKRVKKLPFSIEEVMKTPFNYHAMQPKVFVIPSLTILLKDLRQYLTRTI